MLGEWSVQVIEQNKDLGYDVPFLPNTLKKGITIYQNRAPGHYPDVLHMFKETYLLLFLLSLTMQVFAVKQGHCKI